MNQIGRYVIQGELGRGGMAVVYRARDPNFNREVAIKILPRDLMHDPSFKARFLREAQTIATLEHPAIVPVYDFGEQEGQPYLVMRLMPGGSLADRLKRGPIELPEALRIVGQLAPALDRAHQAGIVHRDLKPANILFDREENAYVADFGLAKIANSDVNLSATAVYGTPAYMSPEQAKGLKEIDGRADLYALGVVAYHMLAGRAPYEADTPIALALKHVMEPAPRLRSARPDLPEQADQVLQRAMAKDPRDRFATASHLHAALAASLQTAPHLPTDPNPSAPTVPDRPPAWGATSVPLAGAAVSAPAAGTPVAGTPAGRSRAWLIGCVAVGLLATAIGAVVLIGGGLFLSRGGIASASATPRAVASPTARAEAPTVTALPAPTRTPRPQPTTAPTEPASAGATGVEDLILLGQPLFAPGPADTRVVYAQAYSIPDNRNVIAAIDLRAGVAVWQVPVTEADERPALSFGGDALAILNGNVLSVLERATGDERWRATLSDVAPFCRRSACVQIVGDVVVAETADGAVLGYSVATGDPLWRYELTADAIGFDVVGEHIIIIDADADDKGLLAFVNPVDGAALTVAPTCRAGGLPDAMTADAVFLPAPAERRLLVAFGFFGTCLTRIDLDNPDAAAPTVAVANTGAFSGLHVVANAAGAYVTLNDAVYQVDAETRTSRVWFEEEDVTYRAVAAFETGVLVLRTETRGTPASALLLLDPANGETRWSTELGDGQPYTSGASTILDDGATYFSIGRGAEGTAVVLRHVTATEMGGAFELIADAVDLTTGELQPLARFTLTQQSAIASIPEPLIWAEGGAWLGVDGGLLWLDWASGEIVNVFAP